MKSPVLLLLMTAVVVGCSRPPENSQGGSTESAAGRLALATGCLKGAAVGGVAGHVSGGHGGTGAAAGCVVGHHEANKKDQQQAHTQQPANNDKQ